MKKGKAARSVLGFQLANAILFPLGIITGIIVARLLGPENRGIYAYTAVVSHTLIPILYFGFGAGVRYYFANKEFKPKENIFSAYSVAFLVGLLASGIFLSLYYLDALGVLVQSTKREYIFFIVVAIPLDVMLLVSQNINMGTSSFKFLNTTTVLRGFSINFWLLLFVMVLGLDLYGALAANIINKFLSLAYITYGIYKEFRFEIKIRVDFIKRSFNYGIRAWLGAVANQANANLDKLIISYVAEPAVLGVYTVSYSLVNLMNQPMAGVLPVLYNKVAEAKTKEEAIRLAAQTHRVMLVVSGSIGILIAILAPFLIPKLYGEKFSDAIIPLWILVPGVLVQAVTRRSGSKLMAARGMPLKNTIAQVGAAIVGVISYYFLIPPYGTTGAALGSTFAYFTVVVITLVQLKQFAGDIPLNYFGFYKEDYYWFRKKVAEAREAIVSKIWSRKKTKE